MPVFYAITAAFLAFMLFAFYEPLQFLVTAWTPGFEAPGHRIHLMTIGALLALLVLSVAVQLYRPAMRVGALLLAAILVGSLTVATVIGQGIGALSGLAIFIVPLAVIAALHPGLRERARLGTSIDSRVLVLAVLAVVPLIAFAAMQLNLHLTGTDEHVAFEHYLMMATAAVSIGLGAIVASVRPAGWRALVYGVAALTVVVGAASIAFPDATQGTNFGTIGGILAIAWAIGFVLVAERERIVPGMRSGIAR